MAELAGAGSLSALDRLVRAHRAPRDRPRLVEAEPAASVVVPADPPAVAEPLPLPRHLAALERANAVRLERAHHRVQASLMTQRGARQRVAEVLVEVPWWAASATPRYLLRWPRRWGPARADAAVTRCMPLVYSEKRLDSLTRRQRLRLAQVMRGVPVTEDGRDAAR